MARVWGRLVRSSALTGELNPIPLPHGGPLESLNQFSCNSPYLKQLQVYFRDLTAFNGLVACRWLPRLGSREICI